MKLESKEYTASIANEVLVHKEPFDALKLRDDKQYVYLHNLKCGNVTYLVFVDIDDIKIALSKAAGHLIIYCVVHYICEYTKKEYLKGMNIINGIQENENRLFRVGNKILHITAFAGGLIKPEVIITDRTNEVVDGQILLNGGLYNTRFAFDLTPYILSDDVKLQRKLDLLKTGTEHLKVTNGLLYANNITNIDGIYKKANVYKMLNCRDTLCEIPNNSVILGGLFVRCTVACGSRSQEQVEYRNCKVYFNKPCIASQATFKDCEIIINAPVILNGVNFTGSEMRVHDACGIKYYSFNGEFELSVKID